MGRPRHTEEVWTWGGPDGQDQQKEVLTVMISSREVWRESPVSDLKGHREILDRRSREPQKDLVVGTKSKLKSGRLDLREGGPTAKIKREGEVPREK